MTPRNPLLTTDAGAVDIERAQVFLANSRSADRILAMLDSAKSVAIYLRRRKASIDAQNDAAEIALRAERRLGELSRDLPRAPAGDARARRSPRSAVATEVTKAAALAEHGITKQQSARWERIAGIPKFIFEDHVRKARARGERLTTRAAQDLARARNRADVIAKIAREPPPLPKGPFRVVTLDPPWPYSTRAHDASHRSEGAYPAMSLEALASLPIGRLAHKDAVLWCWATNAFLEDAFRLVRHWGFTPKSLLTWDKQRTGLGDTLKGRTEHCILAARGRPALVPKYEHTTIIHEKRREHSRKPEAFYRLVEQLCPGSRLEMFARQSRVGWTAWGAEAPSKRAG